MGDIRFPTVVVELPEDADVGLIRSRVHKALTNAGHTDAAADYLSESEQVRHDPAALLEVTRGWVVVAGDVDLDLARSVPETKAAFAALAEPLGPMGRWQYAVVNVGAFNTPERMAEVLATAGAHGWELVAVYDKGSNWLRGMEKGFMLLKRPGPEGSTPLRWCVFLSN